MRFTRHASLVMDWVELFAPVVFEAHRPREWPASGSLLLDDLPFTVRDPERAATGSRFASSARWATEDAHRDAIDELLADVEAAFAGPAFWAPFLERAHAAGIPRLSDWLNSTGAIVEDQFGRRGPGPSRPADTPLTISPLDGFINPIRGSIQPRAYGLKNRERTNRKADAHAAACQPPGRRSPLHASDPRVA